MTDVDLPAVCLLAGGRGKRLGTLTQEIPKPMIPVAGRPFIEWPLGQLRAAGFSRVVLCIGYLGDVIRDYVGDGKRFGLDVAYSEDGPGLDGTLGAIRRALPLLDDPVPILYGDTYLTVDFAGVVRSHMKSGTTMTMTVLRNNGRWDTSNAVVEGGRVVAYCKAPPPPGAEWVDYGFAVMDASAVEGCAATDLAVLAGDLAAAGRAAAWPASERFREIGTPEALAETELFLRSLEVSDASEGEART